MNRRIAHLPVSASLVRARARAVRLAVLCAAVCWTLALAGAAPSSAASAEVKLAKRSLAVGQAGNLTVRLSCPRDETACLGTMTLKSRVFKKKTIASGAFIIVGGRTKALNLHLSKKALSRLKRRHSLHARATVLARDPAGTAHTTVTTVTLKFA